MNTIPNNVVYVDLPPYLVQWYKYEMECPRTIRLPKNSIESRCIMFFLRKREKGEMDPEPMTESYVEIETLKFKYVDWRTYCMVWKEGVESLRSIIRARFRDCIYRDLLPMVTCESLMTKAMKQEKQELIMGWMKVRGIENNDTNFRSILKVFDRLRENFTAHRLYSRKREEFLETAMEIDQRFESIREENAGHEEENEEK